MIVKKLVPTDGYVIYLRTGELATITNALEDAAMQYGDGSKSQRDVDTLILDITKATGYLGPANEP